MGHCRSNVVAGPALNSSSQSFYFWTLTRVYIITFRLISLLQTCSKKTVMKTKCLEPGLTLPSFDGWCNNLDHRESLNPRAVNSLFHSFALCSFAHSLFALCSFALSLKITHFKEQLLAIGSHCILQKSKCE